VAFVGRDQALARLSGEFRQAAARRGRTVLIEGPPGIGKSALVRRFTSLTADATVIWVAGENAERGLVLALAQRVCQSAEEAGCGETGCQRPKDVGPCDGEDEITRTGIALIAALSQVAEPGPGILVLDDAHWCDDASAASLAFALRRLRSRPLMVVLIGPHGSYLHPSLGRLAADDCDPITLAGLDRREIRLLIETLGTGPVSGLCLERVAEQSGGSPRHIRWLLEEAGPAGLGRSSDPLPAPMAIRQDVAARMAGLSATATNLVRATAVAGLRSPLSVTAIVADTDEPCSALEELTQAGLVNVVERPTQREVTFTNPLIRSAVYHSIGLTQRSKMHRQFGSLSDGEFSLQHRAAAAMLPDDALCGELATRALMEVEAGQPLAAARHLLSAARLAPSPAPGVARARDRSGYELLLLGALALFQQAGEANEVIPWMEEISGFGESPLQRFVLGHQAMLEGRGLTARALLIRGAELAGELRDDRCRIGCQILLAQLAALDLRLAEAIRWAEQASENCEHATDAAGATTALVTCLAGAGRSPEAFGLLESLPRAQECQAHEAPMVMSRRLLKLWNDDLYGAREDLTALQRPGGSSLPLPVTVLSLAWLADAEYRLGAWPESRSCANHAVEAAGDSGLRWLEPFVRVAATRVQAAVGEFESARIHIDAAGRAADLNGDCAGRLLTSTAEANLAWAMGDHLSVIDAVEDLDALPDGEVAEPALYPWREVHADALVSLGRLDEAERVIGVVAKMAHPVRRLSSLARVARIRGRIASIRGDMEVASTQFAEALALAELVPAPFERALVDDSFGRHLRQSGQRRQAADRLAAALRTFSNLGAQPFAIRTEQELDRCGLRSQTCQTGPQAYLTPQELLVARLVVSGQLNREVAEELVVSVKTVEYHLRNTYNKLGIRSRRQLAQALQID